MSERYGLKVIQDILKLASVPLAKNLGFENAVILNNWSKIAGTEIAEYTRPIKISYDSKKCGILHVAADNNAAALEIKYCEYSIINELERILKHKTIESLLIRIAKP